MRYKNRYDSSSAVKLLDVIKWQFSKKIIWKKEMSQLIVQNDKHLLNSKKDFICWLGHASFLVQIESKRFLFDPIFGNLPFYKRYANSPYSVEELGRIDYIFISHTHYDHFDTASIKALLPKNAHYILPLGMAKYLYKIDKNIKLSTLNWYENFSINAKLKISLVPAKHWGRRGIFDTNKSLWGGCVVESKKHTIYFAGDTAYDEHFKEIGKKFKINYALLPIGAYEPIEIMRENHLNPKEALKAKRDLNAETILPMHYGTFKLSDEQINAPEKWLDSLLQKHTNEIYKIKVGEVKFID